MIIGIFELHEHAIHTHNDTYLLSSVTMISARRPFLGAGIAIAGMVLAFIVAFSDLLYVSEMAAALLSAVFCVFLGYRLGHLQLLSRDLRGSELGTAIWGDYRHLNNIRRDVAAAIQRSETPVSS